MNLKELVAVLDVIQRRSDLRDKALAQIVGEAKEAISDAITDLEKAVLLLDKIERETESSIEVELPIPYEYEE
jgi:hypothetical protein